jgi:hypothetical protein
LIWTQFLSWKYCKILRFCCVYTSCIHLIRDWELKCLYQEKIRRTIPLVHMV